MGHVFTKSHYKRAVLLCNLRNTAIVCFGYVYVPDSWYGDSIDQISATSNTASVGDNTIGQFAVDFDLPEGYVITGLKGWRTSQIAMLGVDDINISGSTANVVVRNYGARRNGSVTVTVSVVKIR